MTASSEVAATTVDKHRLFQPGDVLDGYVLQDGDCPFSDGDPFDLCPDDGQPDSGTVCGFGDGDRICCAPGAYTAWIAGVPWVDRPMTGNPTALCTGHAEIVRGWVELIRMHTVRAAGTRAAWASR